MFDLADMEMPFGHSGWRISDCWAGLQHNWGETRSWKSFRATPHDRNPVNDALGNIEALQNIKELGGPGPFAPDEIEFLALCAEQVAYTR